mmetsp:Transcript_29980/g.86244  ORF Transcript_29980/g.86244 Transcript_29980/m.86244 type:complete len:229 (+) Transcript_29980:825-1511(+)
MGSHLRMVQSREPLYNEPPDTIKQPTASVWARRTNEQAPWKGSQRFMCPSAAPVYTVPSSVANTAVIAASCAVTSEIKALLTTAVQTSAPLSEPVSKIPLASTMHRTGDWWREIVSNLEPVSASHMMTCASSPALNTREPVTARHQIGPLCPRKVLEGCRDFKSQRMTVLSTEPLNTAWGELARQVTGLAWPSRDPNFFPEAVQYTKTARPTAAHTTEALRSLAAHNI